MQRDEAATKKLGSYAPVELATIRVPTVKLTRDNRTEWFGTELVTLSDLDQLIADIKDIAAELGKIGINLTKHRKNSFLRGWHFAQEKKPKCSRKKKRGTKQIKRQTATITPRRFKHEPSHQPDSRKLPSDDDPFCGQGAPNSGIALASMTNTEARDWGAKSQCDDFIASSFPAVKFS